jgi:hypothetical protein
VSGILGIAMIAMKTTSTLTNLISNIKDAPSMVRDLQSQLHTLGIVLAEVDHIFPAKGEEVGPEITPAKLALDDCSRVLDEVSQALEPVRQGLQAGKVKATWAAVRTATMEDTITASVRRLETFKTTLVIALVIAVGRFVSQSST